MSLARCENCDCIVDTDDGDAYFRIDENGDEIETDEVECSSCREGVI